MSSWLILVLGCTDEKPALPTAVRPVKTIVVSSNEEPRIRIFPGKVQASRKVELAFQVSGLLIKFPVKEGQTVSKGDLIGELRKDEFEARLSSLQGQLDEARAVLRRMQAGERREETLRLQSQIRAAEARLVNARAEYGRMAQLVRSGAVTRSSYDQAQSLYRVAQEDHKAAVQLLEQSSIGREEDIEAQEAQIRAVEGRVVEAGIQLQDCTLRAPYDGVIAQRFFEEGQNVRANEPAVRFQDVEELNIAVDVPETVMVADIRTADVVRMDAELSGAPGIKFPVHIREIAQVADRTTQTFNVRVAMQAPPGIVVLPGMTATVTVAYRRASVLGDRTLIPLSAVVGSGKGGQTVWIVDADQQVRRRKVILGTPTGGQVEIKKGLEPGERVAVSGTSRLREGMKVRDLGDALEGG